MPRVRLEFDLDGEVYPELHAALSALATAEARAERLRQLAAAGLVWEKVRLHGAVATAVTDDDARPSTAPVAAAARARKSSAGRKAPPPPAPVSPPMEVAASRPARSAARPTPRATPQPVLPGGFVDLAIDAEPGDLADPTLADAAEVAQIVRELPVLVDVVAEPEAPEAELPLWARPDPVVSTDDERVGDVDVDDDVELGDAVSLSYAPAGDTDAEALAGEVHVTALVHKPSTRSRLMRMKDRGLFKNG